MHVRLTLGTVPQGAGLIRMATISRKYTITCRCSNSISDLILCRKKIRAVQKSTIESVPAPAAKDSSDDDEEEDESSSDGETSGTTDLERIVCLEQNWGMAGIGSFTKRVEELEMALVGVEGTGSLPPRVTVLEMASLK